MPAKMKTIGKTDIYISEMCLGTMTFGWSTDPETSFQIMDRAVDAGINFFDTADVYSAWIEGNAGGESEQIIGDWLTSRKRQDIVIATKVRGRMWEGADGEGLGRAHIIRSVEESLTRLQVETIDLYQTHWPDEDTALEETFSTFADLIQQGKIQAVGCSNHTAEKLIETLNISETKGFPLYESLQPHYNLAYRKEFEEELQAVCATYSLDVIPYSPLAAGFLTGKYRRDSTPESTRSGSVGKYISDQNYALLDVLEAISAKHDRTMAQIALAWQLTLPIITAPIVGARTLAQLEESLGALGFYLPEEDMARLDEASAWQ